jgi:hypothetical protein
MTNKANMVKALLIFCLFFVFLANANAQKYLVNGSGLEMFYYNNSPAVVGVLHQQTTIPS